jgi:hypothetical protein
MRIAGVGQDAVAVGDVDDGEDNNTPADCYVVIM